MKVANSLKGTLKIKHILRKTKFLNSGCSYIWQAYRHVTKLMKTIQLPNSEAEKGKRSFACKAIAPF